MTQLEEFRLACRAIIDSCIDEVLQKLTEDEAKEKRNKNELQKINQRQKRSKW